MSWYFIATDGPDSVILVLSILDRQDVPLENIKLGNSGVYYYWKEEL